MKEVGISVTPNKTAKQQALSIIKILQEKSSLPIERAKMKLQIVLDSEQYETLSEKLLAMLATVESNEKNDKKILIVCLIEPSSFRDIDQLLKPVGGKLEVLVHSLKPSNNFAIQQQKGKHDDDDDSE